MTQSRERQDVPNVLLETSVFQRDTRDDAIQMANDTPYGLTGSIWTNDLQTALTMSEEVDAGYIWINDHLIRAPGLPFGGWKLSGFGREATAQTLDEFTRTKSVFYDRTDMTRKPRYDILYPASP